MVCRTRPLISVKRDDQLVHKHLRKRALCQVLGGGLTGLGARGHFQMEPLCFLVCAVQTARTQCLTGASQRRSQTGPQ